MKLLRYGPPGAEQPGVLAPDGTRRSLSHVVSDHAGERLHPDALRRLADLDLDALPPIENDDRHAPCVGSVGKLLCIGLNYADHAAETGAKVPKEPVVFGKATSAISGPYDDVVLPPGSTKADWEVELGVVIGRTARYVSADRALEHVAGYCVVNDLSERSFQLEHAGQWIKGKSCDTFGPLGPWLVTTDEVPDPQDLALWLEVDGHRYQEGHTSRMVFGVAELVSYVSRFMSLHPGDVISTGTPPGVGLGQDPPVFLRPGQTVRLGIDGLGEQSQRVVAYEERA